MSVSTPSQPEAASKPANAVALHRVPLWSAALLLAATAALGAWWASGADVAAREAAVQVAPSAATPQVLRERCGGRHLIALHRCLVRECEKPEYQAHRECRRVRDIEARARAALGG